MMANRRTPEMNWAYEDAIARETPKGGDAINKEAARATGVDDPVNPKHYKGDLVMRIIEHFGLHKDFYLANVIKYLLRHKEKAGLVDVKKAQWYLTRAIEEAEGKHKDGVK